MASKHSSFFQKPIFRGRHNLIEEKQLGRQITKKISPHLCQFDTVIYCNGGEINILYCRCLWKKETIECIIGIMHHASQRILGQ